MGGSNEGPRSRSSTLSKIGRFFTGSTTTTQTSLDKSLSPSASSNSSRSNSIKQKTEDLKPSRSQISLVSYESASVCNKDNLKQINAKLNQIQPNNPQQQDRRYPSNGSGCIGGDISTTSLSQSSTSTQQQPYQSSFSRNSSIRKITKPSTPMTTSNNVITNSIQPRFKIIGENGVHEHHLKVIKRQEKLGQMVKDWLVGSSKKRSEAVSAVPNILSANDIDEMNNQVKAVVLNGGGLPPTLFATYMKQRNQLVENNDGLQKLQQVTAIKTKDGAESHVENFEEKYGKCQEVIGRGTFGVVRIAHKKLNDKEVLFAVKEFTRKQNESDKKYSNRLTNEFCISSSLKHLNIIDAFDLFKDSKGDYCEVMEYCQGGDLYSLIMTAGRLEYAEADCFFKQLLRAVHYMHSMGVSHRDLKPENILLTHDGILKITDFGNAECFKMAWEDEIQFSHGISGSSPYIAPEEYTQDEFDPRCVDIWACGVIYMAMRTGRQLWGEAKKGDEFFEEYLKKRKAAKGYEPIEMLKRARCRNVIYSILDPLPQRRITSLQVLRSEWVREINCCKK